MHINRLVERFLRDRNLPPTKFGRLAARDPRLVYDMRSGREIGPEMERKLRHFISGQTPNADLLEAEPV